MEMTTLRMATGTAALALGLGLAGGIGLTGTAAAEDPVVLVSWGGAWSAAVKGAWTDPYIKETGENIALVDYNGGVAEIRAQVEAGNVHWDIVDMIPGDIVRACDEGLLEELPLDRIPAGENGVPGKDDWVPNGVLPCGIGGVVWATVMSYRDDIFTGDKPTSVADFWDTDKFAGKRGLRKVAEVNLEYALMADGVPADQVYDLLATEEGVERAFKKLAELKDDAVWWEAGAQAPQILADKEAVISTAYNGRIYNAYKNENQPLTIMWDTQVWDIGHMGIVKGAPHKERALKFLLDYYSLPQNQARIVDFIAYGPMRKSASDYIEGDIKQHLPTAHMEGENVLQFDFLFWADYKDDYQERFAAWIAK